MGLDPEPADGRQRVGDIARTRTSVLGAAASLDVGVQGIESRALGGAEGGGADVPADLGLSARFAQGPRAQKRRSRPFRGHGQSGALRAPGALRRTSVHAARG